VHSNKLIIRHDICINTSVAHTAFLNSVSLRHICHTFTIALRNTYNRHLRNSTRRSCQWSTHRSKTSWLFLQLLKCWHKYYHSL